MKYSKKRTRKKSRRTLTKSRRTLTKSRRILKKSRRTLKKSRRTINKSRRTLTKSRSYKKRKYHKKKYKGGERPLNEDELEVLRECREGDDFCGEYYSYKNVLDREINGEKGCYSRSGYPVCNIHKTKENCRDAIDNVNESCIWKEEGERKGKLTKYANKVKHKVDKSYKELDTPVGRNLQKASSMLGFAALLPVPGGRPIGAIPLFTRPVIQAGEKLYRKRQEKKKVREALLGKAPEGFVPGTFTTEGLGNHNASETGTFSTEILQ